MLRLLAAFLSLVASASQSLAEDMTFDVRVGGINAAQIAVTARVDGRGYALGARLQTTGLVGALSSRAYAIQSEGRLRGRTPAAIRSELNDQSGRERGRRVLSWSGGRGRVASATPPMERKPWSVDQSPQGAVDPLSAFWSILRAGPQDTLCNRQITTFDGARVGRIVVDAPRAAGDGLSCAARFDRLAGYAPEELAERRSFPFTITFAPGPNGTFRAAEMTSRTPLGRAVIRRR